MDCSTTSQFWVRSKTVNDTRNVVVCHQSLKKKASEADDRLKEAKEQLRRRADRAHKRHLKALEGLSDEEKREAASIHQAQQEADRLREDNAILSSMRTDEEVQRLWQTVQSAGFCLLFMSSVIINEF